MRFIEVAGELTLQSRVAERWEHIYRVIPYPRFDAEYEVANWYTATHPDAPYLTNIIAARPRPDGSRVTLFNARMIVRHANGERDLHLLESAEAFATALREEFDVDLPDDDLGAILRVVEERGARGAPHPFFA